MKSRTRSVVPALLWAHCLVICGFATSVARAQDAHVLRFDLGSGPTKEGWVPIGPKTTYDKVNGHGWLSGMDNLESRDRKTTDALLTDFIFSEQPARFRADAQPGHYKVTVYMGDFDFGNHALAVKVGSTAVSLPQLVPEAGEFLEASFFTEAGRERYGIDLEFSAPKATWIVNGLLMEPVSEAEAKAGKPDVKSQRIKLTSRDIKKVPSSWGDVFALPDPTKALTEQFLVDQKKHGAFKPSGVTRADYLKLIAGNVDFWKQHQNSDGAIIDPYKNVEWQYSTPCFALAATTLVAHADRDDLLEPAAKAMDWSCDQLRQRKGATNHEDFYPPQLAHALPLLKGRVSGDRYKEWISDLASFDPWQVYRSAPGRGNWNVVAFSGEYLLEKLGVRKNSNFVEESLGGQGDAFNSPFGLYLEGPMAYDLFPRIWAADMIAAGYDRKHSKELAEILRRGALSSLFMQSPNGELPMGHRSAHHQWNEAEQCLTYEIYCAKARREGNAALAGAFKRGAHLALQSMFHWQRPSGEMWIVKNRVDPQERHGYEGYSAHSQYNLLPMAMLCIAWEHAGKTENVEERPAPCDVGGFVFDIGERMHKIFANAGGHYIEIEPASDKHYDSTGLVRIHKAGRNPQIGPSDTISSESRYFKHVAAKPDAAIGPRWKDESGAWKQLAEFGGAADMKWTLERKSASPEKAELSVAYSGKRLGVAEVRESYVLTPDELTIESKVTGAQGETQFVVPLLANDGQTTTQISVEKNAVTVSRDGESSQTFSSTGAQKLVLGDETYPTRNGWARLATWTFAAGTAMDIMVKPSVAKAN